MPLILAFMDAEERLLALIQRKYHQIQKEEGLMINI